MCGRPGLCLQLWVKLFPEGEISFVEYDKACAEKYRAAIEEKAGGMLYAGDQSDSALLAEVVADAEVKGRYDIIIDDGGHNPTAQLVSLRGLWPALKSGGIYVVEDVHPTYFTADAFEGMYAATGPMFMDWVPRMTQLLHCKSGYRKYYTQESAARCDSADAMEQSVLAIECMPEACVLVKR